MGIMSSIMSSVMALCQVTKDIMSSDYKHYVKYKCLKVSEFLNEI